MNKIYLPILILGVLYTISSCINDIEDIESLKIEYGQQEYAVPLINTTLSIKDALDNFDTGGQLVIDEDNFMTLVYSGKVYETMGIEAVEVPDIGFPVIDTLVVIPFGGAGTPFDFDFIDIKDGNLKVTAQSDINEQITVTLQIQNLLNDENITAVTFTMNPNNNGPTITESNTVLSNHYLDLSQQEIGVSYTAINTAGQRFRLDQVTIAFENIKPSAIQGYFGKQSFGQQNDSITVDIFKNVTAGRLFLKDPKIRLFIDNNIGVPTQLKTNQFLAVNNNKEIMEFNSVLDQGVAINFPNFNEPNSVKTTLIQFDNTNSNIEEIIEHSPEELMYAVAATINPDEDNTIRGLITDESTLNINMELELPLWLSAEDFTIEETSDLDVSLFDEIIEAEFKLIIENGLPIQTGIQLYFEDDSGIVLDSLFNLEENFIDAAQISASGEVTQTTQKEQLVMMDQARINNFSNATKIRIKSVFSTADASNVASKFYTDYKVSFLLGVKATVKIEE